MQIICVKTRAIMDCNGLPFNLAAVPILMGKAVRALKRAQESNDRKAVAKARAYRNRVAAKAADLQPQPA